MRNRALGFSVIELVVALAIVAVFAGVLLDRAVYYQELAEKASMEQVAADLRSSVNLRVAELALENRFAEVDALLLKNPFELLAARPQNYLGVLEGPPEDRAASGSWYFDNRSKEVVYSIDLGRYFTPDDQGRRRIAWHLVGVGSADRPAQPQWARFELVRPYRWF
jgi:type II secretory pathway pseudopilin PulG